MYLNKIFKKFSRVKKRNEVCDKNKKNDDLIAFQPMTLLEKHSVNVSG